MKYRCIRSSQFFYNALTIHKIYAVYEITTGTNNYYSFKNDIGLICNIDYTILKSIFVIDNRKEKLERLIKTNFK